MRCFSSSLGILTRRAFAALAIASAFIVPGVAMPQTSDARTVEGTVHSRSGAPIAAASVILIQPGGAKHLQATTDASGVFIFSAVPSGDCQIAVTKQGMAGQAVVDLPASHAGPIDVVLGTPGTGGGKPQAQPMEFADAPSFAVAGVTDWTAVGGHGSDAVLRTSEELARETAQLKEQSAEQSAASTSRGGPANSDAAKHRFAGDQAEKNGDALTAVREYEQAVRLDPSEENYLAWGSELLLHRAVWQAETVFHEALKAFPSSARIETALGAALFAGGHYDDAAERLCAASDLDPSNPEPYDFMGKVDIASFTPLACIQTHLARFVQQQPQNSRAKYLYAMAMLKTQQPSDLPVVEALLNRAVALDPHCAEGYLQLGILSESRRENEKAAEYFKRAIQADPQLAEAHYRLGVLYDRAGNRDEAAAEFKLHDDLAKQQADAAERQRRAIKQFVLEGQAATPTAP